MQRSEHALSRRRPRPTLPRVGVFARVPAPATGDPEAPIRQAYRLARRHRSAPPALSCPPDPSCPQSVT
jgi:hypothetical protein